MHGALLLLLYVTYRKSQLLDGKADAHGLAFTMALRDYRKIFPEKPLVSPERFNLLVDGGFQNNWRKIDSGGVSHFKEGNMKLKICRGPCKKVLLVEEHCINYVCSCCADQK